MKHILILGNGNTLCIKATAGLMEAFRRYPATFYYQAEQGQTDDEDWGGAYLSAVGLNDSAICSLLKPYTQQPLDYVFCVNSSALTYARSFQSKCLVFDYHFELHKTQTEADIYATLQAMKQYFERFCKVYLNEWM